MKNIFTNKIIVILSWILITLFYPGSFQAFSQEQVFTIGSGNTSSLTLGVNPFATINRNSRSQYLYYAFDLLNEGATNGNITSIAFNVTSLAAPSTLKPENITIKLGATNETILGEQMIENLPVYYTSTVENITQTGWYTFELDIPYVFDGQKNIIVEICRSNENFGTSFQVETTLNNENDFRTTGLYSNSSDVLGCNLTGTTPMSPSNRRRIPNIQLTMTAPCDGLPTPGITQVTPGPYCSGESFMLSVLDGATESGLFYQWQSSPNDNGPWSDIQGANEPSLSITQTIETYYRRATTCLESQLTANSFPLQVGGEGCYCSALVQNENEIGITQIALGAFSNNSSSLPAYTNFTNETINLERGEDYPLSVWVNTQDGTNYTKAWIDWNMNTVFEETESYDFGFVTGGSNVIAGDIPVISVPNDAPLGPVVMRIRTSQSGVDTVNACGPIINGEAEDYIINIIENLNIGGFNSSLNNLEVFVQKPMVYLISENNPIKSVEIFDLAGRSISKQNNYEKSTSFSFSVNNIKNQIVIMSVTTENEVKYIKKIAL